MLPFSLISLLCSWLGWPPYEASLSLSPTPSNVLMFELRHQHGLTPEAHVVFSDVTPTGQSLSLQASSRYSVSTRRIKTARPSSQDAFHHARTMSRLFGEGTSLDWDEDEGEAPDVERRATLLELAKMANNAYLEPGEAGWYELGKEWNVVRARLSVSSDNLLTSPFGTSRTHLAGNQTQTVFEDMCSPPRITRRSYFQSRVRRRGSSAVAVLRARKTNSTIICCSVAVAHVSTGHGRLFATATVADGSAIKTVWKGPW
jgi:hypothetical protein